MGGRGELLLLEMLMEERTCLVDPSLVYALGLQVSAVGVMRCLNPVFPFGTPSMTLGGTALDSDWLFFLFSSLPISWFLVILFCRNRFLLDFKLLVTIHL